MRLSLLLSTLAAALLAGSAYAAPSDADFVKTASMSNNFEIMTSKLALEKSQSSDVKSFAQMMVDDHTKAGSELKSAVNSSDVDKKLADSKLDAKHQATYDALNKASDKEFDKQYIAAQKEAHADAVKLFSNYASEGSNKTLKEFASNTLPTLKKHKEHVDKF